MVFSKVMFPIVDGLGGWAAVDRILLGRGVQFSREAKKKWVSRQKRLPRDVALALACEANARGIPFTFTDFEVAPKDHGGA